MQLTKHHGLGNDFLVLLDLEGVQPVSPALARAVCDRHRGIGADGIMRVTRGTAGCDVTMELLNADGGRAEMSGNGISCLVQAVRRAGLVAGDTVTVATDAGPRTLTTDGDRMTVDMGTVKVVDDYDFGWFGLEVRHTAHVDVGNPHLVVHVDTLAGVDLEAIGVWANKNSAGGTNVELCVKGDGPNSIAMAVYERGVGLTEACGTGACAVAAAGVHWDLATSPVTVLQPGGPTVITVGDTLGYTVDVTYVATIDFPWTPDD